MKNGKIHSLKLPETKKAWSGNKYLHALETTQGKSHSNYLAISLSNTKDIQGYNYINIAEDHILALSFFLFDIAEKNGLVPSADKTAAEPTQAVTATPEIEAQTPSKIRRKPKKKTGEIMPGDEVVSSGGITYTFQGIDSDGWKILTRDGDRVAVPPSYSLTRS